MALDGWFYLLPAAVAAVWIFRQCGRWFQALCFSAVTGNLALLGVGYLGSFTGVALAPNLFTVGDLTVDTERRTVTKNGREIPLLAKEFSLLEYMVRNKGAVLSREQMEDRIWNYEYSGSSNNIDVYISRLRKKLEGGSGEKLIHTVRGAGWVLRDPEKGDGA